MICGYGQRWNKVKSMMVRRHKKRGLRLDNRGLTMIETLVSFVVLVIILLMLYGMVRISMNLRMRAVDTANVQNEFNSEIYKSTPSQDVDTYYYIGKYASDQRTMFMLELSDETQDANLKVNAGSNKVDRTSFSTLLRIPCIDGTAYVGTDSIIKQENLVPPKVIMFKYHK